MAVGEPVRRLLRLLCASGALAAAWPALPSSARAQSSPDIVVFAAASLKNALDAVGAQWLEESKTRMVVSYAASSALARQIEQGAPAQVFISADLEWMDYLAARTLIKPETRVELLGNRIVLIAAKGRAEAMEIRRGLDLGKMLGDGRLAMANVDAVPAGKYGKAALEKLGMWASVSARIAQAENVRAALLLVSRGEAPLGIVYRTDAVAEPNVAVIGTFPEDSHPPIIYPAALTANAGHPQARALLAYLRSGKARLLFEAQGFTVLNAGRS